VRRTRRSSQFPIGTDEGHPPRPRNGQRGISPFSAQRLAERVCAAIAQWADDVTLSVMPSSMLTTAVRSQLDRLLHVDEQVDAEYHQAAKESGVRQRAASAPLIMRGHLTGRGVSGRTSACEVRRRPARNGARSHAVQDRPRRKSPWRLQGPRQFGSATDKRHRMVHDQKRLVVHVPRTVRFGSARRWHGTDHNHCAKKQVRRLRAARSALVRPIARSRREDERSHVEEAAHVWLKR
jgi:hypothetical protein